MCYSSQSFHYTAKYFFPELHLYSDIVIYSSSQAQNVSAKSQYLERVNISHTSLSRVSSTERPSSDLQYKQRHTLDSHLQICARNGNKWLDFIHKAKLCDSSNDRSVTGGGFEVSILLSVATILKEDKEIYRLSPVRTSSYSILAEVSSTLRRPPF